MSASPHRTNRRVLSLWLARGGVGRALPAVATWTHEPLVAITALLVAVLAFRGCPMCWIVGLVEHGSRVLASPKDTP